MSKSEGYVPTPQQFRCAEQAADRYKAERDRAVAVLREMVDAFGPSTDRRTMRDTFDHQHTVFCSARAFLAEVDK